MNRKRIKQLFYVLALMLSSATAHATLVVIVNANSNIEQLSRSEVVNIFMGRYRRLPDGSELRPLEVRGETPERRDFYHTLLDKSLAEINAYWARLVFSGRTQPPMALDNQRDVLDKVAHDSNAIGYIERANLNNQVKVVYVLPE